MMKIIIPERIQSIPLFLRRLHQLYVLGLIFGHKVKLAISRRFSRSCGNFGENMPGRGIENLLGSIQPESIKMKFAYPVPGILYNEFSNRSGIWPVEIERFPPLRLIPIREIGWGKEGKIIAILSNVIIDHVEDYRETGLVTLIDKTFCFVGLAVQSVRCE